MNSTTFNETFFQEDDKSMEMLIELLRMGHEMTIRVTGRSMLPTLQDEDRVTLKRQSPELIKPGAIILFVDKFHKMVLHRVVRRWQSPDGIWIYQSRGDSLLPFDAAVTEADVLGCVIGIRKYDGTTVIDTTRWVYRSAGRLRAVKALLVSGFYYKVLRKLKAVWKQSTTGS